jgi:flavin-dependent dehydrogenase
MMDNDYDAIVIGGGPAGSTAATLIAKSGRRVLLLEQRETMPFKIGESLIPATFDSLERLGLLDKLRASRFTKKYSVQFFSGSGRGSAPFYFSETAGADSYLQARSQTWQVLRSEFDSMLLENAREHGVEVCLGASVTDVLFDDGGRAVGVRARLPEEEARDHRCRVVIDATGQRALLARRLKIRRHDPNLRMAAIFTHYEGARRDDGIDEGATLILRTADEQCWFWFIPLPDDRASVGVVGPIDELIRDRPSDPQQVFEEELAKCPGLYPRLEGARQAMEVRVLNDFSYSSDKMAGDGWILAGDAFGFLDPIYSSGVFLALRSGEYVADAVTAALDAGDPSERRLRVFEPELRAGMASFRQLIYAFYSRDFNFARFLREYPRHRMAIIDILVGDVFDRDFKPLFDDMRKMIPLPPYPPSEGSYGAAGKQVPATDETKTEAAAGEKSTAASEWQLEASP